MARPRVHDEALRDTLLDAAVAMVASDGIAALALRDVARRAGTSTSAVYALFGSKELLQRAVIVRGYDDFTTSQASGPVTDDPTADIAVLGMLYVTWAMTHPKLYTVMFGESLLGVGPSVDIDDAWRRAMAPLSGAVARAISSERFREADPAVVTTSLWAQVHGIASLLLAGRLDPEVDLAATALATIDGWRHPRR